MKRGFITQTDPETDPEGWELEILEAAQNGLYSAFEMKGDDEEISKDALEKLDQVIGLLDDFRSTGDT